MNKEEKRIELEFLSLSLSLFQQVNEWCIAKESCLIYRRDHRFGGSRSKGDD